MSTMRPKISGLGAGGRKYEWGSLEFLEKPKSLKIRGKGANEFDGAF